MTGSLCGPISSGGPVRFLPNCTTHGTKNQAHQQILNVSKVMDTKYLKEIHVFHIACECDGVLVCVCVCVCVCVSAAGTCPECQPSLSIEL